MVSGRPGRLGWRGGMRNLSLALGLVAVATVLGVALAAKVEGERQGPAPPLRVGVIGAGIGGATTAYYLKDAMGDRPVDITVFETRDYIGGRVKHTTVDGVVVELGADAWAITNDYLMLLEREFGFPLSGGNSSGNTAIGIWDGAAGQWEAWGVDLVEHLISDIEVAALLADFTFRLEENYVKRGTDGTFDTILDFLAIGGLGTFTAETAADYFEAHHVSGDVVSDVLDPLLRVIYDQTADEAHAFSVLVSLTAMISAYSLADGNSQLAVACLKESNATVHLSTSVTAVERAPGGTFVMTTEAAVSGNGFGPTTTTTTTEVDVVVVAAPIEFVNLNWTNVELAPFEARAFESLYVTIVAADGLSTEYFGGPDPVPDTVFVSDAAAASVPWTAIQVQGGTAKGQLIFKIFSNSNVTADLETYFDGLGTVVEQHWPYTFPHLKPISGSGSSTQPILLAEDLYYVNAMESVASAMGGSTIAGRNIALLIANANQL